MPERRLPAGWTGGILPPFAKWRLEARHSSHLEGGAPFIEAEEPIRHTPRGHTRQGSRQKIRSPADSAIVPYAGRRPIGMRTPNENAGPVIVRRSRKPLTT